MNLFDIPKLEQDLKTLESKTLEDGFWNDSKKSGKVLQEIKVIKNKKDKYLKITWLYDIFCCIKADCLYMVTYINNEEENLWTIKEG